MFKGGSSVAVSLSMDACNCICTFVYDILSGVIICVIIVLPHSSPSLGKAVFCDCGILCVSSGNGNFWHCLLLTDSSLNAPGRLLM